MKKEVQSSYSSNKGFIITIIAILAFAFFAGKLSNNAHLNLAGKQVASFPPTYQTTPQPLVVVGAPSYLNPTNGKLGKIYVYSGSGNLLWTKGAEAKGDRFGWSVSTISDIDGDGWHDIVVSAPHHEEIVGCRSKFGIPGYCIDEASTKGKVYVYSGRTGSLLWSELGDGSSGVGMLWNEFGYDVKSIPDINGDGKEELIVGAPHQDWRGRAYVYSSNGDLLWSEDGEGDGDEFGGSVGGGDFDGDGKSEIVVGAPLYDNEQTSPFVGKVYLYSSNGNLLWSKIGEGESDRLGYFVTGINDINGDGKSEIAVSSSRKIYLYSGNGDLLWSTQDGTTGPVSSLEDINGDGRDEVAVGVPGKDRIHIYSGADGSVLWSKYVDGTFGKSISNIDDVNGDGYEDVVVGAPTFDPGGKVFLYMGNNGQLLWSQIGESYGTGFGYSLSGSS